MDAHKINAASAIPRLSMPQFTDLLQNLELYFVTLEYWFDGCSIEP